MRLIVSFILSSLILTNVASANSFAEYETWSIDHANINTKIYGNLTPEPVKYYLSVDAILEKSGKPSDTITINCADAFTKLQAGHAIACVLPPNSQVSWFIDAQDFQNGSQGTKGKM